MTSEGESTQNADLSAKASTETSEETPVSEEPSAETSVSEEPSAELAEKKSGKEEAAAGSGELIAAGLPIENNGERTDGAEDGSAEMKMTRSSSVMNRRRLEERWMAAFMNAEEKHEEEAKAKGVGDVYDLIHGLATSDGEATSVAAALNNIGDLVGKSHLGKAFVRECGGLAVAIHRMAVCIEDENVQIAGCHLLEKIAEDDHQVQDLVGSLEGIDVILDAMTRHRNVIPVQDAASFALRSLTWGESNRRTIVRHGAMQDLVEALRVHENSPMLHEHIICTIAHAVFGNEDGRKVCGNVGAVEAIVGTMRNFPTVVSLQAQCCFAFRNLSWKCRENVARMHENDVEDEIVATLSRFSRIPGIQDQGLAALSNIFGIDSEPLRRDVPDCKKDLVTVVFKALKTFSSHESITRHAQNLLRTMSEISKASGNSAVLKNILTYPDAAKIILRPITCEKTRTLGSVLIASKILRSIGSLDGMQAEIRSNGGIGIVLECLEQFAKIDVDKAPHILEGLVAICSGSDESKKAFNESAGVAKISALMLVYPDQQMLQEMCCMLLDNISNGQFEATASNMTCRIEAIRSVVAAMISYPKSASLQEHACSVMIKVAATSQKDSDDLCSLGARPVVEKARLEHSGNPAVESLANQLLTLLIPSGSDGREGRGQTPQGSSSSRLRSRSRTVQTGQRSRSRMDRSKSREKKRGPAFGGLAAVDENSTGDGNSLPGAGKPKRSAGSKPESRKGRRGGNRAAPIRTALAMPSFKEEE